MTCLIALRCVSLSVCAYTFGKSACLFRDLQDWKEIHLCQKAPKTHAVIKEALWTLQLSSQSFTNKYVVLSFPSVGERDKGNMVEREGGLQPAPMLEHTVSGGRCKRAWWEGLIEKENYRRRLRVHPNPFWNQWATYYSLPSGQDSTTNLLVE